jgi:tetratricopeptide (TPR) repeat protein
MAGRPQSLNAALGQLLRRYRWLFLGFSGADFSYDEHYLGVLDAAADSPGFVFVARDVQRVEPGIVKIRDAYGTNKASIVGGDLAAGWVESAFGLPDPVVPFEDIGEDNAKQRLRQRIDAWVATLGPVACVNIVHAILKSVGLDVDAHWLMRKTWRTYRSPEETRGKSYGRYNYNYGLSLLQVGFIMNPVTLAEDMSNLLDWKEAADQNAVAFLSRAWKGGQLAAGGALGEALAYRGELARAVGVLVEASEQATDDPLAYCDIANAGMVVYDLIQTFSLPAIHLRHCIEIARKAGDEPRRALLSANLGRVLTYSGQFAEADQFISEAERISQRLDLRPTLQVCAGVRGLWLADSGRSEAQAVEVLRDLADELAAQDQQPIFHKLDIAQPGATPVAIKGRNPQRCRVLLDLNRAALLHGDAVQINRSLDELDELTAEAFVGYYPHYCLTYAQCLLSGAEGDPMPRVTDLLSRARKVGTENPWVEQFAAHLEAQPRTQSPASSQ